MSNPENASSITGEREAELLELYADELGTPNVWRDRALADAREDDRVAAVWAAKAEAEEAEFAAELEGEL